MYCALGASILRPQNGDKIYSAQQGKPAVHHGPPPIWHQTSQTSLIVLCGYLLANRRFLQLAPGAKWCRVTATFRPGSKLTLKLVDCLISLEISRSVNSSYMARARGSSLHSSSIKCSPRPLFCQHLSRVWSMFNEYQLILFAIHPQLTLNASATRP